jgi:hypothetical protein
MIVRPWVLGDTAKVSIQQAQAYMGGAPEITADLTSLSESGLAWTFDQDGEILGIAVIAPQWDNRALALVLLAQSAGSHFHKIHRAVHRFLVTCGIRRVEATVDVGFEAGDRWMKMLGFEFEGLMRAYRPDGADMKLYARIT